MQIREIVLKHLAVVVAENSPLPFPDEVSDDMFIDDFWLDSIAFMSLITNIETELGFMPLAILEGVAFPRTIGELIQAYTDEIQEKI